MHGFYLGISCPVKPSLADIEILFAKDSCKALIANKRDPPVQI
jgi:hypothetical protein